MILSIGDNENNDERDPIPGSPRKDLCLFTFTCVLLKPGFTTKERGWGLGLSLTKRIVEEYHGGKIFVAASEPGKGTTFRIILNRKK